MALLIPPVGKAKEVAVGVKVRAQYLFNTDVGANLVPVSSPTLLAYWSMGCAARERQGTQFLVPSRVRYLIRIYASFCDPIR
jgi:hypothetical protein